jgi:hypothetical protein
MRRILVDAARKRGAVKRGGEAVRVEHAAGIDFDALPAPFQERAVEEKIDEWLLAGCAMVWVINPRRRSVSVHRPGGLVNILSDADTLDGGELLPGFALPVADIFRW